MKCNKCGSIMPDDSEFCMQCGARLIEKRLCKKCGAVLTEGTLFCSACGTKNVERTVLPKRKIISIVSLVMIVVLIIICSLVFNSSPIQGVSRTVYNQGMKYLKEMESSETREIVMTYAEEHKNIGMVELYKGIEQVNYKIDIGNHPTEEERYYSKIITKFWKSWAACYGYDAVIKGYEDSDNSVTQATASIYKGMVSDFEDKIKTAKEILEEADNIEDMKKAEIVLDDIWTGD